MDVGAACSDGDLCTLNDACSNGVCEYDNKDCSHLDGACLVGMCDVNTGGCYAAPANEDDPCDDGDPCTVDSCDPSDGLCDYVAGNDGASQFRSFE